jgi:hypothetical protein
MPTEAAEAMSSSSSEIAGMFDPVFRAFGDSLKVAMKAQEDTVKFWSEAVNRAQPAPAAAAGEWIPTAQKNAEEYLRLLESSYHRNAELLKKVIQSPNGAGIGKPASDWLEASMAAVRENAQDLANTNLRVAQTWAEIFKKGASTNPGVKAAGK